MSLLAHEEISNVLSNITVVAECTTAIWAVDALNDYAKALTKSKMTPAKKRLLMQSLRDLNDAK